VNTVFDIAIYITGSIVFASFVYAAISYYFINKKLASSVIERSSQVEALQNKMKEMTAKYDLKNVENTDAFVRFVSQSRDKAFEYIEDVQASIADLKAAEEKVESIPGGYLSLEDLEELRNAIHNVLSHLPEDSQND
jgi:outer membrane murein-binding lipoprotein Lpp